MSAMNPRTIATETATWYLSVLSPHSSHADNVDRYLRGAVLATTRRILLDEGGDDQRVAGPGGEDGRRSAATGDAGAGAGAGADAGVAARAVSGGGGAVPAYAAREDDWRAYLARTCLVDSSSDGGGGGGGGSATASDSADRDGGGGGGSRLSRRSEARMKAFLTGCVLAVPDDPYAPPAPAVTTKKKDNGGTKKGVGTGAGVKGGEGGGNVHAADSAVAAEAEASHSPQLKPNDPIPASAAKLSSANGSLSLEAALSGFSVGESSGANGNTSGGGVKATVKKVTAASAAEKEAPAPQAQQPAQTKSILRSISSTSTSSSAASSRSTGSNRRRLIARYPQFDAADLTLRLELYVRSLRRVRESISGGGGGGGSGGSGVDGGGGGGDECVLRLEPPRAIRARVQSVVRSFVDTVGCVRSIRPVLTDLVTALTRELLAVEALGGELRGAVGRLVSEYEHLTSFASLAFLSTPEESAGSHLSPLLTSYIQYLQSDWVNLVAQCELESMLSHAVDRDVRRMFKTIEFQSIGHLLDVCHEHREHLQNISLPRAGGMGDITAQCSDPKLLRQAVKDVRREVITVNGQALPPARTLGDLVGLLTEALNSKTMTLPHHRGGGGEKRKKKKRGSRSGARAATPASNLRPDSNVRSSASSEDSDGRAVADGLRGVVSVTSDSDLSSGCEGDTDGSSGSSLGGNRDGKGTRREGGAAASSSSRAKRRSFDIGTVEYMTRRLLIAASRTGAGGDAYFVVRDLFGGDEVEVLPSKSQPAYSSSRPNMMGRAPRRGGGGTIELIVRLASVTIKCHGIYDVYPKPLVEDCEPLIQLHTTTTETVSMHEVRVHDVGTGQVAPASSTDKSANMGATVLRLQEKKTDTTGHRNLSIRPALYEKVEVWATPS